MHRITKDSIDNLALWSPLRLLQALNPAAYDTVQYGAETAHPAVAFPFPGLTAIALEDLDSLDLDQVPDGWIIKGTDGLLPDSVPLTASWQQLHARYGEVIGDPGEVTVMFCRLPGFFFFLNTHLEDTGHLDVSLIPAGTTIKELLIRKSLPAGWACVPQ
jgi:hypothetical protein